MSGAEGTTDTRRAPPEGSPWPIRAEPTPDLRAGRRPSVNGLTTKCEMARVSVTGDIAPWTVC
jgi:hypothetical protein